jgi:hypothetical protein
MKIKTNLKNLVIVCATLLCIAVPGFSKAQIANPYPVTNNLGCDVEISYKILDAKCNPVCSAVITISAGTTFPVPLCPGGYDIIITIDWIGNPGCTASMFPGPVNTSCSPLNTVANVLTSPGCPCPAANINAAIPGASIN